MPAISEILRNISTHSKVDFDLENTMSEVMNNADVLLKLIFQTSYIHNKCAAAMEELRNHVLADAEVTPEWAAKMQAATVFLMEEFDGPIESLNEYMSDDAVIENYGRTYNTDEIVAELLGEEVIVVHDDRDHTYFLKSASYEEAEDGHSKAA